MAYKPGTRKKPAGSRKRAAISGKDKAKAAWATVKDIGRVGKEQAEMAKLIALYAKDATPQALRDFKKSIRSAATASRSQAAKDTYKDLPGHVLRSPKVALTEMAPRALKYAKNNPWSVVEEAAYVTPWGRALKKGKQLVGAAKNIPKKLSESAAVPLRAKGMKKGGPVKKCKVDGIAKRGFTKAYSMKKGNQNGKT
tara:strand:+ start:706 stop:1296 length:591 start_codon:yes stop_codon:yes gene_type:complete